MARLPLTLERAIAAVVRDRWPLTPAVTTEYIAVAGGQLATMAIDRLGRIYYCPAWIDSQSVEDLSGVVEHEVWHYLDRHADRRAGRNPRLWNVACDVVINSRLRRDGRPLPRGAVYPETVGIEDSEATTPEAVYAILADRHDAARHARDGGGDGDGGDGSGDGDGGGDGGGGDGGGDDRGDGGGGDGSGDTIDDVGGDGGGDDRGDDSGDTIDDVVAPDHGSGADGLPRPWDADGDPTDPVAIARADAVRQQVADAARAARQASAAGGGCGTGYAAADEIIVPLPPPRVPWDRILARRVSQRIAWRCGDAAITRARPSRRPEPVAAPRVPRPATVDADVAVAVVADTSASMHGDVLRRAIGVCRDALRRAGSDDIRTYQCATAAVRVDPADIDRIRVSGGTDMSVGIAAATADGADVVVVATDCATPWPTSPPRGVSIVVVAVGAAAADVDRVPAWATVIRAEVD